MLRFVNELRALASDETAPTAAEYSVLAALVAVVIVTAVGTVGSNLLQLFERLVGAWPK